MQKKFKGILLFVKIYKDNDLFIKFLSNTDELITGIVYGGLSKKKRNIYQIGFFLNFNVSFKNSLPPSISGELVEPFMFQIMNDKYKLNCLSSTISIINLSIIEGQKVKDIFNISNNFLNFMAINKKWISHHFIFLLSLLKIIGYEIEYEKNKNLKYYNMQTLEFTNINSSSAILFPHNLLEFDINQKISFISVNNFFRIFETILLKYHISNLNLNLPNQYLLFKKLVLKYFKNK